MPPCPFHPTGESCVTDIYGHTHTSAMASVACTSLFEGQDPSKPAHETTRCTEQFQASTVFDRMHRAMLCHMPCSPTRSRRGRAQAQGQCVVVQEVMVVRSPRASSGQDIGFTRGQGHMRSMSVRSMDTIRSAAVNL